MVRPLFLILGFLCVGLAVVGAFLPLMPTTIFLILAAGCFARSSPPLEAWLMNHARFGPMLSAWRRDGAIAPKAKALACVGITGGYLMFWLTAKPHWPLALGVGIALAAVAGFILTRPNGPKARP